MALGSKLQRWGSPEPAVCGSSESGNPSVRNDRHEPLCLLDALFAPS